MNCKHENWIYDLANDDFAFYCPECEKAIDPAELPPIVPPIVPPLPDPIGWEAWEELLDCIAE